MPRLTFFNKVSLASTAFSERSRAFGKKFLKYSAPRHKPAAARNNQYIHYPKDNP